MTRFYAISDNTSHNVGMPEIKKITDGIVDEGRCTTCGAAKRYPSGDLLVVLGDTPARLWPDVMACGDYPLLIVSERLVHAFHASDICMIVGGEVQIKQPIRNGLSIHDVPQYYWIDGMHHFAATMNFEASGFVDVIFCPECCNRSDDIGATYDRQHSKTWPYSFNYDAARGLDLFVTDLSPTTFFCTDRVLKCVRKFQLTNLRFIPTEAGEATWSKGIDYLGKQWPPYHPLRPSEGKTLDHLIQQLRKPTKRYEARLALLDLGKDAAPAVPSLTQMLDDEDETLRREVALLLNAIGKLGVSLGAKEEEAAKQYEEWLQKTLGCPSLASLDNRDEGEANPAE